MATGRTIGIGLRSLLVTLHPEHNLPDALWGEIAVAFSCPARRFLHARRRARAKQAVRFRTGVGSIS